MIVTPLTLDSKLEKGEKIFSGFTLDFTAMRHTFGSALASIRSKRQSKRHRGVRYSFTYLNDIQRLRDSDGSYTSHHRGNSVLTPRRAAVVLQTKNIFFCESRASKELKQKAASSQTIGLFNVVQAQEPTAKLPGAFRAAVQPQPRYSAKPSSATMRKTPRPRKASGFVLIGLECQIVWKWVAAVLLIDAYCRLIFKTSRGRRTISPTPIKLVENVQSISFISDCRESSVMLTFRPWHAS